MTNDDFSYASAPPSPLELEGLCASADIRDRAFAASVLSLRGASCDGAATAVLYDCIRRTAEVAHADLRAQARSGALDRNAFLAFLSGHPIEIRDHLVEEVLGIAYPPLAEKSLPRDSIHYCPSGLAEILFTIAHADLGPEHTFVDLGSGLGKVAMLVALLTGARVQGVELDADLVVRAQAAARSLALRNVEFVVGDLRRDALPPADSYYMYIPLIGSEPILSRLRAIADQRKIKLFSQALDLASEPWLTATGASSYWLQMYESRRQ